MCALKLLEFSLTALEYCCLKSTSASFMSFVGSKATVVTVLGPEDPGSNLQVDGVEYRKNEDEGRQNNVCYPELKRKG